MVNAGLTLLYWDIGDRIRRQILGNQRAEYGQQIPAAVSQELTKEYGKGFAVSEEILVLEAEIQRMLKGVMT